MSLQADHSDVAHTTCRLASSSSPKESPTATPGPPKALREVEGDFFGDVLPASPALAEVVSPEKQGSINKHSIPWEEGREGGPASSVPCSDMAH